MAEHSPSEPWNVRQDWRSGLVFDCRRSRLLPLWVSVIALNVAAFLSIVWVGRLVREAGTRGGIAVLLSAVGCASLLVALRVSLAHWRRGQTVLRLQTIPGIVGSHLKVTIHLSRPILAQGAGDARLLCLARQGRCDDIRWEHRVEVDPELFWQQVFPLRFHIPSTCLPTSAEIDWELRVTAPTPGGNYSAVFQVPVFTSS